MLVQVLDAATKLKMTHEEDNEDKIILKAIMDVNLPKFSSSDSKLFQVDFHMIDTKSHLSTKIIVFYE